MKWLAVILFALCVCSGAEAATISDDKIIDKIQSHTFNTLINIPSAERVHIWFFGAKAIAPAVEITPKQITDLGKGLRFRLLVFRSYRPVFLPNERVLVESVSINHHTKKAILTLQDPVKLNRRAELAFGELESDDDFWKCFNTAFTDKAFNELHQDWPTESRDSVLKREIALGMKTEMVYAALGSPTSRLERQQSDHKEERWIYESVDQSGKWIFEQNYAPKGLLELVFGDGVLTDTLWYEY